MKHIKNKKIYKILMINYFKAFVLSLLLGVITIASLFYISSYVSSDNDPSYAERFMNDDYNSIDEEYIIDHYGTMMVVNDDLEIIKYAGEEDNPSEFIKLIIGKDLDEDSQVIDNNKIGKKYWDLFLYKLHKYRKGYDCSLKYNDSQHFYLITKMPVSVTFLFSIDINTNKEILPEALSILGFVVLLYSLVLFAGMFIYSKITAGAFVKPLDKLCDGVKKLEEGKYEEHIYMPGNGEFNSLAQSFNNLCDTLKTEKKKRKETEDNRKRLILDISHDLKNPLTGVMGSLEMCMNIYGTNSDLSIQEKENENCNKIGNDKYRNSLINENKTDKMNHYLRMAYNNSLRANTLTERLFEFSKLESPDYKLDLKKTDFCEFMRICILEEVDEMDEAGIIGEYDIPDEPIYANIDEKEFKRAVHNLISNAVKYNKEGTVIKISVLKEDDKVKLTIEDNGIGMDKSLEYDIFKRFKRNEKTEENKLLQDNDEGSKVEKVKKTDGTGLGLAIVEKIVNMHKGKIYLETDINKGCMFTIEVPEANTNNEVEQG